MEALPIYYAATSFFLEIDCVDCMNERLCYRTAQQEYPASWMKVIGHTSLQHIKRFKLFHNSSCRDHQELPAYRNDFAVSFTQGSLGRKLEIGRNYHDIAGRNLKLDKKVEIRLQRLLTVLSEHETEPGLSLTGIKMLAAFMYTEARAYKRKPRSLMGH